MNLKFAFVTGGADRIGKAMAIELARQGYNLYLHYNRSADKAEKLKQDVEAMGVLAETIQIDFLEENNFEEVFRTIKSKNIGIEILVNCASDFVPSGFENPGSSLLQKEMKINFENAYLLTKAFAKVFEKGQIINFLDTKIEKNFTHHLDYLLSKKLLKEFTKLSAVHLAPNFKVNAIAPGLVLPPKDKDENYLMNLAKDIPLKTIGNLEEVVKAFRFLISADFITGQIIYVDGGDHLL